MRDFLFSNFFIFKMNKNLIINFTKWKETEK